MKKIFVAMTVLPLLTTPVFAGPNMNAAANDVCVCLEDPHNQARKMMDMVSKAQASGDMSQMMAAQGDMTGVMDASDQCFDALTQKYPEIAANEQLQDEVMAIAETQCPSPPGQMLMQP